MWYLICILGGLIIGYVIKGKIRQWGRNSTLTVNTDVKAEKKPRKRLFKRNK